MRNHHFTNTDQFHLQFNQNRIHSFYGKFIVDIHKLRSSLDELLKKDVTWDWNSSRKHAFNQLKRALSSELLLTHYNPRLGIIVSSDASNKGLGACIQ